MSNNHSTVKEFLLYLKINRAWWLAPIIITLVIVGTLVIFTQGNILSPLIYALL